MYALNKGRWPGRCAGQYFKNDLRRLRRGKTINMLKIEILKEPRVYDYDIFGLPPGLHVNLHFAVTSLVYSF